MNNHLFAVMLLFPIICISCKDNVRLHKAKSFESLNGVDSSKLFHSDGRTEIYSRGEEDLIIVFDASYTHERLEQLQAELKSRSIQIFYAEKVFSTEQDLQYISFSVAMKDGTSFGASGLVSARNGPGFFIKYSCESKPDAESSPHVGSFSRINPGTLDCPGDSDGWKESSSVKWAKNGLNWSHFSKVDDHDFDAIAYTDFAVRRTRHNGVDYLEGYAFFRSDISQVIDGSETDQLLQHEQVHFDICELVLRKLKKELLEKPDHVKVEELERNYRLILEKTHKMYDEQTDHGRNEFNQTMWNKMIEEELEKHANYAPERVQIK